MSLFSPGFENGGEGGQNTKPPIKIKTHEEGK
jgi:hypothetical protein